MTRHLLVLTMASALFVIVETTAYSAAKAAFLHQFLIDIVHICLFAGLFVLFLHNVKGQIDTRQILGKAIFLFLPGADPQTNERDFDRIGGLS